MIKVCADPELFSKNFDYPLTATMTGRQLIDMLRKLPKADGMFTARYPGIPGRCIGNAAAPPYSARQS